ncbi:lytic murein transglycosylase [Rhodobacter capsulatus]|uniref:lytic murein transglycosylase n=1 Tax=Rhodobacter capsulatus TaxID=1061 RepID=UPI0006DC3BF2|nr:lytic murein transglycosylase [Rhodobacter capsulatus]KQB11367.1 murein transglycosylase [Rhodobacter capsulatus]KQB16769.1 murein transglycosylase [Rhodobacter capsulatus]PZX22913.1 lytic murein transglycosylase [Rhodobacter capsulatus]QNR63494.1 lytic murein transglycosylase [Rhodobacter capsulatus]
MKHALKPLVVTLLAFSALTACGGPLDRGGVSMNTIEEIPPVDAATQARMDAWVAGFKPRAMAAGISEATWNRAMRNVPYNPQVIERQQFQAEFVKPIWDYMDSAASDERIAKGRAALAQHAAILREIEARYGVDKEVVVAVWGMESRYGAKRGNTLIIPALATLAHDGRRAQFFESQLIGALKILQAGDIDPAHMTGSWAGAMGHTQFIPTSYLAFAVDFTGDGKRDIWSDNPADALASTAAYLARSGWSKGQPWAVEVSLPEGFDAGLAGKGTKRAPADWAALGVRGVNGGVVPNYGAASILLPAGPQGPALMIFGNFTAISRYNNADAYVMGVGHLSDRLKGQGPFVHPWPREGRALTDAEKVEVQRLLTAQGYDTKGTDGLIGAGTIGAVMDYQRDHGMTPNGWVTIKLLESLRKG